MRTIRTLAAMLAIAALTATAAYAKPSDMHAYPARAVAAPTQDLRSPDARDAAAGHRATAPAVQGPPAWPADPKPISRPAATSDPGDGGIDTPALGLGVLGALLAVGAAAGLTTRRRARATA